MGQVYAFGYQQRHPEWKKNAMLDYPELIKEHFGVPSYFSAPSPSLYEMFQKNPKAVIENMLWNLQLTPYGIQLLLFNKTSSEITPDYRPVPRDRWTAIILSLLSFVVFLWGLILFCKQRRLWWNQWIKKRVLAWLMMLSWVPLALVIILTQRPRPSYLFPLEIFLMSIMGMAVYVILHQWPIIERRFFRLAPAVIVFMIAFIPPYYPNHDNGRPLFDLYKRLIPFKEKICDPDARIVVNRYPREIQNYSCHTPDYSRIITYSVFRKQLRAIPLYNLLEENKIDMIYIDKKLGTLLKNSKLQKAFLESPQSFGWDTLTWDQNNNHWMILSRQDGFSG